jgi:hypothetical protein
MKFCCIMLFLFGVSIGAVGGYFGGQWQIYRALWNGTIMNTSMANNREPAVMSAPVTIKHIKAPHAP